MLAGSLINPCLHQDLKQTMLLCCARCNSIVLTAIDILDCLHTFCTPGLVESCYTAQRSQAASNSITLQNALTTEWHHDACRSQHCSTCYVRCTAYTSTVSCTVICIQCSLDGSMSSSSGKCWVWQPGVTPALLAVPTCPTPCAMLLQRYCSALLWLVHSLHQHAKNKAQTKKAVAFSSVTNAKVGYW